MRKQLKSILLLLGVSLIIFSGCKKDPSLVSPSTNAENQLSKSGKHGHHGKVTITWTYTGAPVPGTFTGTAVAHGALETTGTSTMKVNRSGDVANCSQTLVTPAGTLTILSTCHFSTNAGIWWIASGTGGYANLTGKGTLLMSFPGGAILVMESFTGKIKGHDDDGEDEDDDSEGHD